jgi:hypothetical protein
MPSLPPFNKPPFSFFRGAQAPRDPFDELLIQGAIQVEDLPVCDIIPLGQATYQDTCISGSGTMLALVQETTFEIYRVTHGPGNP